MREYVIFSCDWESRADYKPLHFVNDNDYFEEVSLDLIKLSRNTVQGKIVWYCKIDFFADITYYDNFRKMADMILENGGELGLHVHHISKEKSRRADVLRWGFERMKQIGFPITTYSAGNGEVLDSDADSLVGIGFKTTRGAFPYLKHHSCDWTDADLWPGYINSDNYKKVDAARGLFTYPLGGNEENYDGYSQLHITPYVTLDRLKKIFDDHINLLVNQNKFPCVGCYFRPYDLVRLESVRDVDYNLIRKWESLANWLSNNSVKFLLDSEAEDIYNQSYR